MGALTKNTELTLQYRDEDNWKKETNVVLQGEIDEEIVDIMSHKMDEGFKLVASHLGLPDPEPHRTEDWDHYFTEVLEFERGTPSPSDLLVDKEPTVNLSIQDLCNMIQHADWGKAMLAIEHNDIIMSPQNKTLVPGPAVITMNEAHPDLPHSLNDSQYHQIRSWFYEARESIKSLIVRDQGCASRIQDNLRELSERYKDAFERYGIDAQSESLAGKTLKENTQHLLEHCVIDERVRNRMVENLSANKVPANHRNASFSP